MALTKRAKKLKMENEACHRDQHPATEHTTADARIETIMEHPSQPLQNPATSSTSSAAESMLELDPNANNYSNLFESPDATLLNTLRWAHANAVHPNVAAWLHACSQLDAAVASWTPLLPPKKLSIETNDRRYVKITAFHAHEW